MTVNRVHHIAIIIIIIIIIIIAADYQASKRFNCGVLRCELLTEVYREHRDSWMGDWR